MFCIFLFISLLDFFSPSIFLSSFFLGILAILSSICYRYFLPVCQLFFGYVCVCVRVCMCVSVSRLLSSLIFQSFVASEFWVVIGIPFSFPKVEKNLHVLVVTFGSLLRLEFCFFFSEYYTNLKIFQIFSLKSTVLPQCFEMSCLAYIKFPLSLFLDFLLFCTDLSIPVPLSRCFNYRGFVVYQGIAFNIFNVSCYIFIFLLNFSVSCLSLEESLFKMGFLLGLR